MSFADWLTGGTRSEYVTRRVDSFRKDYQRSHERDGLKIDPVEFKSRTLDVKHDAEDSYDRWS